VTSLLALFLGISIALPFSTATGDKNAFAKAKAASARGERYEQIGSSTFSVE